MKRVPKVVQDVELKPKRKDVMLTLVTLTVYACVGKFLMEGVSIHIGEHVLDLGHADSGTYAALLAPILGAHGYITSKKPKEGQQDGEPNAL